MTIHRQNHLSRYRQGSSAQCKCIFIIKAFDWKSELFPLDSQFAFDAWWIVYEWFSFCILSNLHLCCLCTRFVYGEWRGASKQATLVVRVKGSKRTGELSLRWIWIGKQQQKCNAQPLSVVRRKERERRRGRERDRAKDKERAVQ